MGPGATGAGDVVMGPRGYRFDSFLLDVERGALLGDGEEIALGPKSFDVLHYLVRHPQRLVSRDELLKAACPGMVVTDDEALRLTERAIYLGRNHARVQSPMGGWAYSLGDPDLGARLQGRAVALDPVNAVHLGNYGQMLYSVGRLDEAADP